MWMTKNFWQDFFARCMMNCRRRKRKIDSFKLAIDMFSHDFMEDGRSDWVEQEREEL